MRGVWWNVVWYRSEVSIGTIHEKLSSLWFPKAGTFCKISFYGYYLLFDLKAMGEFALVILKKHGEGRKSMQLRRIYLFTPDSNQEIYI